MANLFEGHGATFTTISPADEEPHRHCHLNRGRRRGYRCGGGPSRLHKTVVTMSGADRGKYLFRIARLVQERARELSVAESLDNGKPIQGEPRRGRSSCGRLVLLLRGVGRQTRLRGSSVCEPASLGVAAPGDPLEFPLLMLAWKIAPALAAGNTVVLKPAETTSLSALIFAEILQQADLPPGVVNIVTGAGATGASLVPSRCRE